jgi:hypothetical protein
LEQPIEMDVLRLKKAESWGSPLRLVERWVFVLPISYWVTTSLPKGVFNDLQELQHGKLRCTPEQISI